jgi:phosphatidylinositol-3,4,5-trisphosphate 3-phosphatase/dual-specificity protein phosphatase PTEN
VFFGWFWFIPAFHLPEQTLSPIHPTTHFLLRRKEVDFPLGVGEALIDIDIEMEWCSDPTEQPATQTSDGSTSETTGLIAHANTVANDV